MAPDQPAERWRRVRRWLGAHAIALLFIAVVAVAALAVWSLQHSVHHQEAQRERDRAQDAIVIAHNREQIEQLCEARNADRLALIAAAEIEPRLAAYLRAVLPPLDC